MALYFYFNETTGDLVYSDQATYSGSGYTSLGQQTNTNPTSPINWIFNSQRENIKTVTKDPNISRQIDVLTKMYGMFNNCGSLISLDLSGFDTSNVKSMNSMFRYCTALTSLDLSCFDTSNVTNMYSMFYSCTALTSLDLSGFDTSNVTDMGYIFYKCSSLTFLDLSGFDTSHVTDMGYMFYDCTALTSLDLSGFDTSNVTDMASMFNQCISLISLDLSGFDTSHVTDTYDIFTGCDSLRIIDISKNMSDADAISRLPAATYYDAVTRQSYAKAEIPGGSTYVRNLADLDLIATMVQTRIGINVAKHMANKALKKAGSISVGGSNVDIVKTNQHKASYDKDTLEIVVDSTGKVTSMYFVSA